jgi:hypothetical protein
MAKVLGYSIAYQGRYGETVIVDDNLNEIVVDNELPRPSILVDGFAEYENARYVKIVECDENGNDL